MAHARPDADTTVGAWTSTGATLYEVVDEVSADDGDYIAIVSTQDTCELRLSDVTDPVSSSGHVLRIRRKSTADGYVLTYDLRQGSTSIKTASVGLSIGGFFTTLEVTLSGAEADSITDYTDLNIQLNGKYAQVSWIEFEVPSLQGATPQQLQYRLRRI